MLPQSTKKMQDSFLSNFGKKIAFLIFLLYYYLHQEIRYRLGFQHLSLYLDQKQNQTH